MKVCMQCQQAFTQRDWNCPACSFAPAQIAGFPAFAPDLAQSSEGFKVEHFAALAPLEAGNFWFRSRNQLLLWALQRYFPQAKSFLEIGCGTGFVLAGIQHTFPHLDLAGSEIYSAGLTFAAQRLSGVELFQMDACHLPFAQEFDVIGAFDVLEHIAADEVVLSQMRQGLRQGGGIVLTVPQHAFLWSQADEEACHVRRYSARELRGKVERAGFRVVRMTSFVSLLFPLMIASRLQMRRPQSHHSVLDELRISGLLNHTLEKILSLERTLIQWGLPFPAGGSLLVVARKAAD